VPGAGPHALLTRAPLPSGLDPRAVRLACVRRAASVRSEPGSNSQLGPPPPQKTPKRGNGHPAQTASLAKVAPAGSPPKITRSRARPDQGLLKGDRLEPRATASPATRPAQERPKRHPRARRTPDRATADSDPPPRQKRLSQRPKKGRRPRIPSKTPPPCPKNIPAPTAQEPLCSAGKPRLIVTKARANKPLFASIRKINPNRQILSSTLRFC
jgi:hypothetical protein